MTRRLGIIGAGRLGTALGRLVLAAGWDLAVSLPSSGSTDAPTIGASMPGARVATEAEVAASDIVVLAVPISKLVTVDLAVLSGAIVVDAMNHWRPVDGGNGAVESAPSSSHWVRSLNPAMRLVKSLNHLGYRELEQDARPAGHPERRALAAASDDVAACDAVARLIDDLGFDPVEVPFSASRALEPGGPVFGRWSDARGLRQLLHSAGVPVVCR